MTKVNDNDDVEEKTKTTKTRNGKNKKRKKNLLPLHAQKVCPFFTFMNAICMPLLCICNMHAISHYEL